MYRNNAKSLTDFTGHCEACELELGMETNENLRCEETCGDGMIFEASCDDGNTISGDGCSESCTVEYGFRCENDDDLKPSVCIESIQPEMTIKSIDENNVLTMEFSEPVKL